MHTHTPLSPHSARLKKRKMPFKTKCFSSWSTFWSGIHADDWSSCISICRVSLTDTYNANERPKKAETYKMLWLPLQILSFASPSYFFHIHYSSSFVGITREFISKSKCLKLTHEALKLEKTSQARGYRWEGECKWNSPDPARSERDLRILWIPARRSHMIHDPDTKQGM